MSAAEQSRYLATLEAENRRLRGTLQRVRELATTYTPSPDLVEEIAAVVQEGAKP